MPPETYDFVLPIIPYWAMFWLLLITTTIAYIMALIYYKKACEYRGGLEKFRDKGHSFEPDANLSKSQISPRDNTATINQSIGDDKH